MADGRRAAQWKHTAAIVKTLCDAHFKGGPFDVRRFDPYADHSPAAPLVENAPITILRDVFIDHKFPEFTQ